MKDNNKILSIGLILVCLGLFSINYELTSLRHRIERIEQTLKLETTISPATK